MDALAAARALAAQRGGGSTPRAPRLTLTLTLTLPLTLTLTRRVELATEDA